MIMAAVAATALAANANPILWEIDFKEINYAFWDGVEGSEGYFDKYTSAFEDRNIQLFTEAMFYLALDPPNFGWDEADNLLQLETVDDLVNKPWTAQLYVNYMDVWSEDEGWEVFSQDLNVGENEGKFAQEYCDGIFLAVLKISENVKDFMRDEYPEENVEYLWFIAQVDDRDDGSTRIIYPDISALVLFGPDNWDFSSVFDSVPEPATGILVGLGAAVVLLRRRRNSAAAKQD